MDPKAKRRQAAAALVVQSFFTMGKKSTAQPRPALHVPPRGIGPISEPNQNDVLCGRGGRINAHEGNVQFRDIVQAHKKEYLAKTTKKLEKAHIAARIVEQIRTMDPPGRFLKEDSDTGLWFDIGDAKAIKKAGQALREDAPDIRQEIGSDAEEDGGDKKGASPKTPSSSKKPASSPPSTDKVKKTSPPNKATPRASTASAQTRVTSGRGAQQNQRQPLTGSWNSATSSQFGMSFPQPVPPRAPMNPAASGNFPSTHSVGSAGMHSLSSQLSPGFPGQLYQGIRGMARPAGALSKHAADLMNFQQFRAGQHPQQPHPDEVAFGRHFTPTELSSGSTMSTLSGVSSLTGSNLTGSHLGAASALSMGSSGYGHPATMHHNSLRLANLQSLQHMQHPAAMRNPRGSCVSELTNSFMSSSGLTRSPSFGELTSSLAMPMSDSSFVALMAEDKEVGDILANMPPPNSSGTSSKSSGSRKAGSGRQSHPPVLSSSAMSVTSAGSNKSAMTFSMRSVGSDNSWMHPYHRSTTNSSGEDGGDQPSAPWPDDRSMMSDVSESIIALDLAGPTM